MILDKVQFFVGGSFLKTKKIKASAAFYKWGRGAYRSAVRQERQLRVVRSPN